MIHHSRIEITLRLAFLLVILLMPSSALAQGERGTLNGIVTDANGAVVPNAEVIALNLATNVETKTMTTDSGVYRLPYLPLGLYKITVKASGFQTSIIENVNLHVAQTLTVDFKLQPGQISDQVTVTAAPLIETGTAEIGRYVTKTEFDTWPIPIGDGHRQIQQFIFTSLPGSVGNTFQGSINGGQFYSHEILIEGIPLGRMDLQGGSNNEFSPSAEAVSEFKLQTGTIGAQYGGGQTSVANFAIKSGTNDLHGSAFTYIQNDVFNANSLSNKAVGRPRPPFKLFNWGYAFSGPAYIPRVYNGRNKTFWFTNLESTRQRNFTSTSFSTLPVKDFKQGNFSRLFDPNFTGNPNSGRQIGTDALGRPIIFGQIYDPRTTRVVNGQAVRDPFPGNIIPQTMWSPVSKKILELAPITDPIIDRMLNNIPALSSCCPVFDERIAGFKVDHHFNEKHRMSAYYNHHYRLRNNSPTGRWGNPPGTPTGVYQIQYTPGRMVRIAEDWTISNNVLNHFAIGYNRFGNANESVFVDQGWPEKIGLQNVAPTHFPTLVFGGQPHQGGGIGAGGRLGSGNRGAGYNGSTIIMDDLTIIRGAHNFKTGFELRKYYYNLRNKSGSGDFNFQPIQTELPGFASQTGHSFASFLLGAVNSASRGIAGANFGYRVTQPGFYFMDDWKVNQKLTLNLGLRWEIISPYTEVAGRMSVIDLTKPNPGAGNRPGALVFAEDLGIKSFQNTYWRMISPRFGFAYAINPKLVVRGGYGINNIPFINNGFSFPGTLGYSGSIAVNSNTVVLQNPRDPVMFLHDRFPDFRGVLPNKDLTLANNLSYQYMPPDSNRVGYTQNYNLGFQYELPAKFVLEASYIGNKGTRLEANGLDELNQLPVSALAFGDKLLDRLSAHPGLVPVPYPGFNGTVAQALRPFPQFASLTSVFAPYGTSHYDSLQIQLTRHLTEGLAVLAAYTWSKAIFIGSESAIDSAGAQDVYNRRAERTITSFSIPQIFKLTWIYDLPFGKGKRFNFEGIQNPVARGFLNHVLGGWTLTAIHNYRSGDPLSITGGGASTVLFNGTVRPDLVAGQPIILNSGAGVDISGRGDRYLNPAAFAPVPMTGSNVPLRLGSLPVRLSNIRGPHRSGEDFGLRKSFAITEQSRLEFRFDFFSALNRGSRLRGNPVTNISDIANFGKILGGGSTRSVQFEGRITF